MDSLFEVIGWIGVIMLLLAYWSISQGVLNSKNLTFHMLNLFGAIAIIINTLHHNAYAPAMLNVVWASVAAWGVYRLTLGKK